MQGENEANMYGAQGIKLPPISFLSGTQNPQPLTLMNSSVKNQSNPVTKNQNVGMSFFGGYAADYDRTHKMSLPQPQALNLYPKQNQVSLHALSPNPAVSSGRSAPRENQNQKAKPKNTDDTENSPSDIQLRQQYHHHTQNPVTSPSQQYYLAPHIHRHNRQNIQQFSPNAMLSEEQEDQLAGVYRRKTSAHRVKALQKKRQKQIVRSRLFDQLLRDFPSRRHLGTLVYNPTATWDTLRINQLSGLLKQDQERLTHVRADFVKRKSETASLEKTAYVPVIPPFSSAYINCYLEVKIPYKHIKAFKKSVSEGKAERKRELWGGYAGIYTDDSNPLYVLCHLGLFDMNLDLTECNADWVPSDVIRPEIVHKDDDGDELLDLSVTLLLLPGLNAYRGFYRNGLNSRSWPSKAPAHSGLSIAVYNVKWETLQLSAGERMLHKNTSREYTEDKNDSAAVLAQRSGWRLDSLLRHDR